MKRLQQLAGVAGLLLALCACAAAQANVSLDSTAQDAAIYSDMASVHVIGNRAFWALLPLLVAFELIRINWSLLSSQLEGNINSRQKFMMFYARLFLVLLAFFSFNGLFQWIVYIFDSIGNEFGAQAISWSSALDNIQQLSLGMNILTQGPLALLQGTLAALVSLIDSFFYVIRYTFLGLLYCLGPLCLVAAVSSFGVPVFKNWLKAVVQVSAWAVFYSLIKLLLEPFMQHIVNAQTDTGSLTSYSGVVNAIVTGGVRGNLPLFEAVVALTVIVYVMCIPKLAAVIISGENIGGVASIIQDTAVGFVAKEMIASGHPGSLTGFEGALRQMGLPSLFSPKSSDLGGGGAGAAPPGSGTGAAPTADAAQVPTPPSAPAESDQA